MIELFSELSKEAIVIISAAAMIALILGYVLASWNHKKQSQNARLQLQQQMDLQLNTLNEQLTFGKRAIADNEQKLSVAYSNQLEAQRQAGELEQKNIQLANAKEELMSWQKQYQQANEQSNRYVTQLESQAASFKQQQIANDEKLALLESTERRLQEQFENLANKIFEQKQQKFAESSKAGLDNLLSPLKDQIEGFKKQVTDQYVKEGQERASLKTEILGLKELNQQITQEASALTKALKGDNKQQGNWGEVVLERILTESGLREGHEFETQVSLRNESGKLYQPDVVVHLPNDKDIVIDSKVSLSHYERYFNQTGDDKEQEIARKAHLNGHINSIKSHIRELGKKDYQDLKGIRTLDYILMFVPIESAFFIAVDQSPEIVKMALDNNIMIVSPTNLLVALRTINNIWQYEYQNQNAQEISKKAADMYDKFVSFVDDLEGLGASLTTVHKKYDGAMNKLTEGRGNLVKRAEDFRSLGVQTKKRISSKTAEKSTDVKVEKDD